MNEVCAFEPFSYVSKYARRKCFLLENNCLYVTYPVKVQQQTIVMDEEECRRQTFRYTFSSNLWRKFEPSINTRDESLLLSKIDSSTFLLCLMNHSSIQLTLTFYYIMFQSTVTMKVEEQALGIDARNLLYWCTCKTDEFVFLSISCEGGRFLRYRYRLNGEEFKWEIVCDTSLITFFVGQLLFSNNKLYYFGGPKFLSFDLHLKTWSDLRTNADRQFGYPNGQLLFHNIIPCDDFAILSGGKNYGRVFDDVWSFHFPTLKWNKLEFQLPIPLQCHAAVVYNNDIFFFGGFSDTNRQRPNIRLFKLNVDVALQQCYAQIQLPLPASFSSPALSEVAAKSKKKPNARYATLHFFLKCLSCGPAENKHAFCLGCLEKLSLQSSADGHILCPKCRLPTRMPPGGVKELSTKMMLTLKCEDCERYKPIRDQWWCKDCKATVCSTCILIKHRSHKFVRWENFNVPSEYKTSLKKQIDSSAVFAKKIKDGEKQIKKIQEEIETLKEKMHKTEIANGFVNSLDETFGTLALSSEPVDEKSMEKKFRVTLELMKKFNICSEINVEMLI